jgi:hypothetical protein
MGRSQKIRNKWKITDIPNFLRSGDVKDKRNNNNRRNFLKTVGIAGLASVFASTQAGNSLVEPGNFSRMKVVTKKEVNRAIEVLTGCLDIHRRWIERYESYDGEEEMLGHLLGDIDHHRKYVIEYEFVIDLLESIKEMITA